MPRIPDLADKKHCKDCGKVFIITLGEEDFYLKNGLQQPKRCERCRELNREKKTEFKLTLPEVMKIHITDRVDEYRWKDISTDEQKDIFRELRAEVRREELERREIE